MVIALSTLLFFSANVFVNSRAKQKSFLCSIALKVTQPLENNMNNPKLL